MASGEKEPARSLSCKVWVLKAQIHCEGCKKKIKKILNNIPGVIETDIDSALNKITVKGIVDVDVLIRKLAKHGKHAQIWTQNTSINQNDVGIQSKTNNDSKTETSESKEFSENSEEKSSTTTIPTTSKANKEAQVAPKPPETNSRSETSERKPEASSNFPRKLSENPETSRAHEPGELSGEDIKHGKKAQKELKEELKAKNSDIAGSITPVPVPAPSQVVYQYPYHPMYSPAPAFQGYGMSYNVAQPSVSHSYYASPMPLTPQGYVYQSEYPPPTMFSPPPAIYSPAPATEYYYYGQPMDASSSSSSPPPQYNDMNMFSEENPNACNLM